MYENSVIRQETSNCTSFGHCSLELIKLFWNCFYFDIWLPSLLGENHRSVGFSFWKHRVLVHRELATEKNGWYFYCSLGSSKSYLTNYYSLVKTNCEESQEYKCRIERKNSLSRETVRLDSFSVILFIKIESSCHNINFL